MHPEKLHYPVPLFVYGTLRPRGHYWSSHCEGKTTLIADPVWVRGRLYALPEGYPALAPGHDRVYGTLFAVHNIAALEAIDRLEDYQWDAPATQNFYQRELASWGHGHGPYGGWAWLYRMDVQRIEALHGRYIPHGVWPTE